MPTASPLPTSSPLRALRELRFSPQTHPLPPPPPPPWRSPSTAPLPSPSDARSRCPIPSNQSIFTANTPFSPLPSLLCRAPAALVSPHASPRRFSSGRDAIYGKNQVLDGCVNDLAEIVRVVGEDASGMEAALDRMDLRLSPTLVAEVLRALNEWGISASRFFSWVLSCSPEGASPSSEVYNLLVDNLGRVGDYETMFRLLGEISAKGHCLTREAFSFLAMPGSFILKDSIRRIVGILNGVGGSCRGSGIFSLIEMLGSRSAFDLAIFVMEETERKTAYYNVLIAAKCRRHDFQGARELLDEMRSVGCEPNVSSYNYLVGCLLKNERVYEACALLETMEKRGCLPDSSTYELLVFHACANGKMDLAMLFVNRMLSEGLNPRIAMHASFIKGYFFSGRVGDAANYADDMSKKDESSANINYSLLASLLCRSKRVKEAAKVLYEMMKKGLKPNFRVYMRVRRDLQKTTMKNLASELKSMYLEVSGRTEAGGCIL